MHQSIYSKTPAADLHQAVNRAFSKQSHHYDQEDEANIILKDMRQQVYAHVGQYLKPGSHILELNAGTGIDAVHFAQQGHRVHATDLSDGMIEQIALKVRRGNLKDRVTYQRLSYERLEEIGSTKFDYVFSNFGGLNCISDLSAVTTNLQRHLRPGSHITFVIMPRICLWELAWMLQGKVAKASRRLGKDGAVAHLEGEHFKTYYHSLKAIKAAFNSDFQFLQSEGLCAISPPPASFRFVAAHPSVYRILRKTDGAMRNTFPFDRWGDHIIVTFRTKF